MGKLGQPVECYTAIDGYLIRDCFGQFFVDTCQTEHQHLMAPTPEGAERRQCRKSLEQMFPENVVGKKGKWFVHIRFTPEDSDE